MAKHKDAAEPGAPTPESTEVSTIKPTRTRTKPGEHSLYVTLDDQTFADLEETADGRPLNMWLSKLIISSTIAQMVGAHVSKTRQAPLFREE